MDEQQQELLKICEKHFGEPKWRKQEHQSAYLMAVGGAAYLVSKAIRGAKVVAFEDLGMEAIYEFEVKDMPVTVAVDATGESVHATGPKIWQAKIEQLKAEA